MKRPDDEQLDGMLVRLPRVAPSERHLRLVRAQAEAALGDRPSAPKLRTEPLALITLAAAHLCWALVRVYVFR